MVDRLTFRERVEMAIKFQRVDRVPIMYGIIPAAMLKYNEALLELFNKYPSDFGPPCESVFNKENLPPEYQKGEHYDAWNCLWKTDVDGVLGIVQKSPLEDWKALKTYKFPDLFPSQETIKKEKEKIKRKKEKYFVLINAFGPSYIFERLQNLRGYYNLMVDFIEKPEDLYILLERLTQYMVKGTEIALELEPDIVGFGDDWGTQKSLITSPDVWREFFKPIYKRVFGIVHAAGCITYFHSDGVITEIIPDFIEIGLDILNPQFSCMDLPKLAKMTKDKLCISSDIDRQYILPRGTPEEVREYVKEAIRIFDAKEGGFIGRGEINMDVPLSNAEVMYQTFLEV